MKIALLGKTGSGKGTYAQMLEGELKIERFVAGDLLREEAKKGTKIGEKIKKRIDKGVLVPPKIVADLINEKIKNKRDYIIDGFPRSLSQLKFFKGIPDMVIYVTSDDKIIMQRLLGRRQCLKCGRTYNLITLKPKKAGICDFCGSKLSIRADETKQALTNRLNEFKKKTLKVINYYKKKDILIEINGNRAIKEVYKDIRKLFK